MSLASVLGAGVKPSTWLPPGELAQLPPSLDAVKNSYVSPIFIPSFPACPELCCSFQSLKMHQCMCNTNSVLQQISALSISMDMALRQDLSLIPKLCYSRGASRSDSTILRISCLKPALATNMFASQRGCSFPGRIITLRAEAS